MSLAQRAAPHLNWRILQMHFFCIICYFGEQHSIFLTSAELSFCIKKLLALMTGLFVALWIDLHQLSQLGLGFQGFPDGHVFTMTLSVAGAVLKLQLEGRKTFEEQAKVGVAGIK